MPTRNVPVGTSPTLVTSYTNERTSSAFKNNGAAVIFVSEDETGIVAEGFPLAIGQTIALNRAFGDEPQNQWFAQVASGTESMRVLEQFGELPELVKPPRSLRSEQQGP